MHAISHIVCTCDCDVLHRNVSSDGPAARKQLRECDGLLESLLNVTHSVIGRPEMGKFVYLIVSFINKSSNVL